MKFLLSIIILSLLLMLVINEYARYAHVGHSHRYKSVLTIHDGQKFKKRCSWHCHHSTRFCAKHHLTLKGNASKRMLGIYYDVIQLLHRTGNYQLVNILLFVVLIPLYGCFMLISCFRQQQTIQKLRKESC